MRSRLSLLVLAGFLGAASATRADIGAWTATNVGDAPNPRTGHMSVWTGSEMIVWGGVTSTAALGNGKRYDPVTDTWTPMTSVGAPKGRAGQAVWTGTEMMFWGGFHPQGGVDPQDLKGGARYDPAADSWREISYQLANAPTFRIGHTVVWTGERMIVWGGFCAGTCYRRDGAIFDPAGDGSWTPIPTSPLSGRDIAPGVWTGQELVVYGGRRFASKMSNGARYNPATETWTLLPTENAPGPRAGHTALWTGSRALIWGGALGNNRPYLYDPDTDSWTAGSGAGAPGAREFNTAVWTGSRMIVWGGSGYNIQSNRGGIYDPTYDTWTLATLEDAPSGRIGHSAVWTGDQMVVWGGQVNNSPYNGYTRTGGRYRLGEENTDFAVFVRYLRPIDLPFRQEYYDAMVEAVTTVQQWYKDVTGRTFRVAGYEVVTGDPYLTMRCGNEPTESCRTNPAEVPNWNDAVQSAVPILERGVTLTFAQGGGGYAGSNLVGLYAGFVIVADHVLEPISGVPEPAAHNCALAGNPPTCTREAAFGTVAHELGHAFGLHHPLDPSAPTIMNDQTHWPGELLPHERRLLSVSPQFGSGAYDPKGPWIDFENPDQLQSGSFFIFDSTHGAGAEGVDSMEFADATRVVLVSPFSSSPHSVGVDIPADMGAGYVRAHRGGRAGNAVAVNFTP